MAYIEIISKRKRTANLKSPFGGSAKDIIHHRKMLLKISVMALIISVLALGLTIFNAYLTSKERIISEAKNDENNVRNVRCCHYR